MSATDTLRDDHKQIKRLDKIISKCYSDLNARKTIPFPDLEKITLIISEFLDSIQGLATLKAFGQSTNRADSLEFKARDLFRKTMWVLGTNVLSRGITDCSITIGAAAALALVASRVVNEQIELS